MNGENNGAAAGNGGNLPYAVTLSRWSGEFVDPAAEAAFGEHVGAAELHHFIIALFVTGPLYFAFVISDHLLLGFSALFWLNAVLRFGVLAFCWGLGGWLLRHPLYPPQLYRLTLLFFFVVLGNALLLYPVSQREFLEIYPGLLVMMVGAFFFIPSTLNHRLLATAFAIAALGIETLLFFPPPPHQLPLAVLFFVVTLIFCVVTSVQHARLRRFSFIDSAHSRHLAVLLQQEVGLRRQLEEAARVQARTDALTGLPNRRRFFELAEREMERALRYDAPLAVVMLDLDHFKDVNDRHGHAAGDQVLRAVGDACRDVLRTNDIVGRLGGEEFAILLPETNLEGACQFAERLRQAIAACRVGLPGTELSLTATLGVAARVPGEDLTLDELLARADAALYRGKAAGRNRVEG
ncbi:MAG: hypothetical protein Kow0096_08370 [Thiohalomonadaceae bacterium]